MLTTMREALECFLNAVPPELPLEDLMQELITYYQLPAVKVQAWLGALCSDPPLSQHTCADLMKIDTSRVNAATETASLTEPEVQKIKMALGTPSAPFEFKDKVNACTDTDVPVKKRRGGSTTEVSEVLPFRRPPLTEYHPPSKFDPHRRGAATRNEKELVKLVVQEVCTRACSPCHTHLLALTQVTYSMSLPLWLQIEEVCGDLYPDADERAIILNAIQAYTGALNIANFQSGRVRLHT